jgi:outer membrane protein
MKIKLILIGALLSMSQIFGQQTQIDLESAIQIALQNNREIEIAKMEVKKSDAAVSEAFGYALPTVDLTAGFTHFLEKPKTSFPDFGAMLNNSTYGVLFDEGVLPRDDNKFLPMDFKLQTFAESNNYEAKVQVTQILFNSAVFTGIGASHIYRNLAVENLKSTIAKTVLDIKEAYYGVLLTRDLYTIAQSRFVNANDHLNNIKAMRAQGLVSEFAEMQVEVQVENIRPLLAQLENTNIDATNGFKILLNIPQDNKIKVLGEMVYEEENLPSVDELVTEAKTSNLSLKTLKIKNKLDDEYASLDRGNYWPTIAAFGTYSYAGASEELDFSSYGSSIVGLNFSINLFEGGRTKNKVEQDIIISKQTGEQIKSLTDVTEMLVKSKYNDLTRVKKQIEAMQKNISLAKRAYKIAEDRYNEGVGSELEVKDADVSLSEAKINYTNAVHDYLVAKATLYNLVGRVDEQYYDFVSDYLEN